MLKKVIRNISYLSLVFCMLFANFYVPKVQAKTLGDVKKELAKLEDDYNNNRLQKDLSDEERRKVEQQISSTQQSIYQAGVDIDNLNEEIQRLNDEIDKDEEEIQAILAFTQVQNGESAYLEYAFGAQDFTDFIYRLAVSEQLTTYNNELIETNKRNIAENQRKTEELEKKKKELAAKQVELKEKLEEIKVNMNELDELSGGIKEQIQNAKNEIKALESIGCKDDEDITTCGNKDSIYDTSFARPVTQGHVAGNLGWFGPRDCSNPKVSCFHWGLDITTYGSNTGNVPVYSVANGIVVSIKYLEVDSNGNYKKNQCGGRKVYIMHNINGKIYTTGYYHLRSVNVKENQIVTKETQIGVMGGYQASGYEYYDSCSTGAHLHLAISTGTLKNGDYSTKMFSATNVINFPKQANVNWYDRYSRV